ncbi:MAG: M48 family metallopeptidase [Rhodospirillales bacterium]|nr:M48 family metallopeptidase [Rhodospirillales bacterium]
MRKAGASLLKKRILSLLAGVLVAYTTLAPLPADAQQRINFIRDAEIENTIRAYAAPLFTAAGFDPSAIRVHLINDRQLNAFVANGLNMYINTGLLIRADNPGQVIGVIAHETGHISGGHLARLPEIAKNATAESLLMMLLGAAAIVGGQGDVGAAIIAGGTQSAERTFLRYSRELESSADQAGVKFLDRSGQSSRGLLEFLQILADQELLSTNRQDPYVRTHPITRERVDFVRNWVERSRYSDVAPRPEFVEAHRRMRAKLEGYLDPGRALQVYKDSDTSIVGRYARAIAYSRRPDYDKALVNIDSLLAERPNDGYFHEARGQMLFEAARPTEALQSYQRAVELLPNEPLIRADLAQVELTFETPEMTKAALNNLEIARRSEPTNTEILRRLSIAYGRDGQRGMFALTQAERAALLGRREEARVMAERAQKELPPNTSAWLRAQDIRQASEKPDADK